LARSEYNLGRRKDLVMRNLRTFNQEFKRQVVEELLSGESRPAQLCRRHNISASLLYHWKKQYSLGKFNNEPIEEAALKDRIEKLERLVGKLTLENEFLKKGLQHSLNQPPRNGKSLGVGSTWSAASGKDAGS
jgi:transposase